MPRPTARPRFLSFPPKHEHGRAIAAGDGAGAFLDGRGRDEPAPDLLQLFARGRARLSARDLAAPRRGRAVDPRGQGLVRRTDAARTQYPRAAEPAATCHGADDA